MNNPSIEIEKDDPIKATDFSFAEETKQKFSGERINPFDKTTKSAITTSTTTTTTTATSSFSDVSARKFSAPPSHPPPPLPKSVPLSTSPKSASNSRKSSESDRSLDDIIKDRFEKNQGVRDDSTGRYSVPIEDITKKSSNVYSTSSIDHKSSDTDNQPPTSKPTVFDTKRFDYQSQSKFSQSGGSASDLDIIFGGNKPASTTGRSSTGGRYSVDQSSFSSISTDSDIFEVSRNGGANTHSSSSSYKGYAGSGIKNEGYSSSIDDSKSVVTSSWKNNTTHNDDYDLK